MITGTDTPSKPLTVVGETSYLDLDEAPLSRTLPTVLLAMADAGVRVMSVGPHMGGFRLWVDPGDADCARDALTEIRATYRVRPALLVETVDQPEGLVDILDRLDRAGLALTELQRLESDVPALWGLATSDLPATRAALG
jgi:hypothetical protein